MQHSFQDLKLEYSFYFYLFISFHKLISKVYTISEGKVPIVGVGGIMDANDAWEKITAGASLLQAYSGFVFEGPALTKIVVEGLAKKLRNNNLTSLNQAIGLKHRRSDA